MVGDVLTRIEQPSERTIAEAAQVLSAGRLAVFPTETVYGLGGDARNDQAVARIFAAKDRPSFNPLIVHAASPRHLRDDVVFTDLARKLATVFWPGPLTLVLPKKEGSAVSLLASAGLDTLAVRVPDHPIAAAVLEAFGALVAAPSANRSGRLSPTEASHVAADPNDGGLNGMVEIILDGGPCHVGLESTVVDARGATPVLLRAGGVSREALEAEVGPIVLAHDHDSPMEDHGTVETPETTSPAIRSPGQTISHYAPSTPVRCNATEVHRGEALLAFGPSPLSGAAITRNLSPDGDVTEAAARLFADLRSLDQAGCEMIAVMPIPNHGLGLAVNDRLHRAAVASAPPRALSSPLPTGGKRG